MMNKSAVEVSGLSVKRGRAAVFEDLDIVIPGGKVTGVLGPSGCGKTTLLRAIVGAQSGVRGEVRVLGLPAGSRALRRRVSYATQAASVYDDLTVVQNLRFFARALGAPRSDAERVMDLVALGDRAGRRVDSLSGGERSRVSLAVALLGDPELIVLDEPTVGLDPVLRAELWGIFARLAEAGAALVVSSHVMARTPRFAPWAAAVGGTAGHENAGAFSAAARTLAVAERVLRQLSHDPRSVVLLLVAPALLVGLFSWLFSEQEGVFDQLGGPILALFPFILMFVVTSVTTLRERRSGTLERLMTTPLGKTDFIAGYALAFGLIAVVQAIATVGYAVLVCGLEVEGPVWQLGLVAVLDALLGTALGLLASAFARTEFQAVQFMPLVVIPQILVGGLLMPRERMPDALQAISDWLPLSYAVDAVNAVAAGEEGRDLGAPLAVIAGVTVLALALAAATLRRRTP